MVFQTSPEVTRCIASCATHSDLQAIAQVSHGARTSLFTELLLRSSWFIVPPAKDPTITSHPYRDRLTRFDIAERFHIKLLLESGLNVRSIRYQVAKHVHRSMEIAATVDDLARFHDLRSLHLSGLRDVDLTALFTALGPRLHELHLQDSYLTVDSLSALGLLTELRVLDLEGTTKTTIDFAKTMPKLRFLNLRNQMEPPNGNLNWTALKTLRCLETLHLHEPFLDDTTLFDGCAATLKHLSIHRAYLIGGGSSRNGWLQALARLKELITLSFRPYRWREVASLAPLANLAKLEYLELEQPENGSAVDALAGLPHLQHLCLHAVRRHGDAHLLLQEPPPSTTSLWLNDFSATHSDTSYHYLAKLPALTQLQYTGYPLCFKSRLQLPCQIKELILDFGVVGRMDFEIDAFVALKQLTKLSITVSGLCTSWGYATVRKLVSLEHLELIWAPVLIPSAYAPMIDASFLRELVHLRCLVLHAKIDFLPVATLAKLTKMDIRSHVLRRVDELQHLEHLEEVLLAETDVSDLSPLVGKPQLHRASIPRSTPCFLLRQASESGGCPTLRELLHPKYNCLFDKRHAHATDGGIEKNEVEVEAQASTSGLFGGSGQEDY